MSSRAFKLLIISWLLNVCSATSSRILKIFSRMILSCCNSARRLAISVLRSSTTSSLCLLAALLFWMWHRR